MVDNGGTLNVGVGSGGVAGRITASTIVNIGNSGAGTLNVNNGGVVSSGSDCVIGNLEGSSGTATVSGIGSRWNIPSGLFVGGSGNGSMNVENGGVVSNVDGTIAQSRFSNASATISGAGSQWNNSGQLDVGSNGTGTLAVGNGGSVSNLMGVIGNSATATGTATVTGSGSQWNNFVNLIVGLNGSGTMNVENGGAVSNNIGFLANSSNSRGTVTVSGAGSQWINSQDLVVGTHGVGFLNIENGGVVSTANAALGRFVGSHGNVAVTDPGSHWNISGNLSVGGSFGSSGGTSFLNIVDNALVTIDGTTNVYPEGTINVIEASLDLTTGNNDGWINNIEGVVDFEGSLTNNLDAFISGNGLFSIAGGLTNQGNMISSGVTDVHGNVDNVDTGMIVTTGGSSTSFFNDVVHNGAEIQTFEGSSTTFFGQLSGAGDFTGPGSVVVRGGLRPGNSSSVVNFAGDLVVGLGASTEIELGGLEIGEFDQLNIAGNLTLDGTLNVVLVNGFALADHQQFLIANVGGTSSGQFSNFGEGDVVGSFGGVNLYITYVGGDGNDIVLLTSNPLVEYPAESVDVFRGSYQSGELSDIANSDDSYLKYNPGLTLNSHEPPVSLILKATLPDDNPVVLEFELESHANTAGLTQTIEAFNFTTGLYEVVDFRAASFNTDATISVDLTDDIALYVEPQTGGVRVRVSWHQTGPVLLHPWTICIDQAVWNAG